MTIQANPPLPDPVTGRMPQYTQVLQQNSNGQWVVMYDVANVQSTSTLGPITPVDPGFTTPIEEFPDPVPEDPVVTDPVDPAPEDPVYTNPDIPSAFGGGGRDDNQSMAPTGPGAVQFGGSWFDGETGQPLGDLANSAYNSLTGGIPGLGPISVVGKVIGAMAKANMRNAYADMTDEARASMFGSEIGQKALSEMSVEKRSNLKKSLQTKMQNRNKGLNVGFDVHPDYSYDENQRNMRDVAGEVDLNKSAGTDSNFSGTETTGTGSRGPGGAAGRQKGGPSEGTSGGTNTGSRGPGGAGGRQKGGPSESSGGTSTGSRGAGGAGGRQKGGPSGRTSGGGSTSGGQGQSPGGPGRGRSGPGDRSRDGGNPGGR